MWVLWYLNYLNYNINWLIMNGTFIAIENLRWRKEKIEIINKKILD